MGKVPGCPGLLLIHKGHVIAQMPTCQQAQPLHPRVPAPAGHPLLKQVSALLRRIAAGDQGRHFLALQQTGALLLPVILTSAVYQPVQSRLHRRGAVPGVNRGSQHQQLRPAHALINGPHIVLDGAGKVRPVPLTAAAGAAGRDLHPIQIKALCLRPQQPQFLLERRQQRGGISPGSGTCKEHGAVQWDPSRRIFSDLTDDKKKRGRSPSVPVFTALITARQRSSC